MFLLAEYRLNSLKCYITDSVPVLRDLQLEKLSSSQTPLEMVVLWSCFYPGRKTWSAWVTLNSCFTVFHWPDVEIRGGSLFCDFFPVCSLKVNAYKGWFRKYQCSCVSDSSVRKLVVISTYAQSCHYWKSGSVSSAIF